MDYELDRLRQGVAHLEAIRAVKQRTPQYLTEMALFVEPEDNPDWTALDRLETAVLRRLRALARHLAATLPTAPRRTPPHAVPPRGRLPDIATVPPQGSA